ncbi:MAG: response regulator [Sulfurospirillum sp.]|nr:response regulator [Sulfurospirillum sp.]
MSYKSIKNYFLFYVLLVGFLSLLIVSWLNYTRSYQENLELAKKQENLHIAYQFSLKMYELVTKEVFDIAINTPFVLELFRQGVLAQGEEKEIARELLYENLMNVYESLYAKNLRQLHFHEPDGKSFLRFHSPQKFGDDLFEARPSVKIANEERRFVQGFEVGKVVSGYRFVYPLFYEGDFLGTVEASITIKAILDSLQELNPNTHYAYIINKKIAENIIFEENKKLYKPASLHSDYFIEDSDYSLSDSPKQLSIMTKNANLILAHTPAVQNAINRGEPISTFVKQDEIYMSVTLLPMQGISGRAEGYLISYEINELPIYLWRNFIIILSIGIILIFMITGLIVLAGKRAKENLKAKQELRIILDTLGKGVYVIGSDGVVVEVNQTACDLLGYKKEEILGKEAHALFHTHAQNGFTKFANCPLYESLQELQAYFSDDQSFICKNGKIIPVVVHARPLIREGEGAVLVTAFFDNTQAKESFEQLQNALQVKTQFLANMSHELRTPLNAIMGFEDLLREHLSDANGLSILEKLCTSSKLLLHIVNDILDFSTLEAHKIQLEKKPLHIEKFLYDLEDLFSEEAAAKNLELSFTSDVNVPDLIEIDEFRVKQILMNLLSNAIKFTYEGTVNLHVSVKKLEPHNALLQFAIKDTGIGIDKEKLADLFEPFSQADISATRRFGGIGLGLSIVKQLAKILDADIQVSSIQGEGSTFCLFLPVKVLKQTLKLQQNEKPIHVSVPKFLNQTFLIVEDNSVNQEVLKAILERTGAKVVIANNGLEAVELFTCDPHLYCAIFMDIHMPILDGYESTKRIRKIDTEVLIIALTAAAGIEDRQKALDIGMNEHLSKPIEPSKLYTILQQLCKAKVIDTIPNKKEEKPLVLIVDDAPSNIHTLSNILKKDYRIKIATDGKTAIKIAKESKDLMLILLDIVMPHVNGYAVCKELKNNSLTQDIPIVFVTAKDSSEDEAYGFSLGAADYVTKPFSPMKVKVRVKHEIELKQKSDALAKLSMSDALTGLKNRGYFDVYFARVYKEVLRDGGMISVMMIDVDYFKPYNDNYGHAEGDVCLKLIANALISNLKRPSDLVARYGGEEFVVILKNTSYKVAQEIATALKNAVDTMAIKHEYSKSASHVSISIGLAHKAVDAKISKDMLLKKSDEALYRAKETGRDRVVSMEITKEDQTVNASTL